MFSLKITTRCLIGVLVGRGGDAALAGTGLTHPATKVIGIRHKARYSRSLSLLIAIVGANNRRRLLNLGETLRLFRKTAATRPKAARAIVPGSGVCAIRRV